MKKKLSVCHFNRVYMGNNGDCWEDIGIKYSKS